MYVVGILDEYKILLRAISRAGNTFVYLLTDCHIQHPRTYIISNVRIKILQKFHHQAYLIL